MPRRPGAIIVVLVLAAVFAASWHLDLWLVVCAMAATALALVAWEGVEERAAANRVAAWALHAPSGVAEGSVLEQLLAADLAATAGGCRRLLDDSLVHAQQTIGDPWARALAAERLSRAKDLSAGARVSQWSLALDLLTRRVARVTIVAATAGVTLLAAAIKHHALLVLITLFIAAAGLGGTEARRRYGLRTMLRDEATLEPARGCFVMPEDALVGVLRALASSRSRVLSKAASLVSTANLAQGHVASSRLAQAARDPGGGRRPTVTPAVLGWMGAAAAMVVGMQLL